MTSLSCRGGSRTIGITHRPRLQIAEQRLEYSGAVGHRRNGSVLGVHSLRQLACERLGKYILQGSVGWRICISNLGSTCNGQVQVDREGRFLAFGFRRAAEQWAVGPSVLPTRRGVGILLLCRATRLQKRDTAANATSETGKLIPVDVIASSSHEQRRTATGLVNDSIANNAIISNRRSANAKWFFGSRPSQHRTNSAWRVRACYRQLGQERVAMLSIAAGTRIFFAAGATILRKGFDGLQGLVCSVLEQDPLSGHLFLFVNRRRDKL